MNFQIKIIIFLMACGLYINPILARELKPSDYQKLDPRLSMMIDQPEMRPMIYSQMTGNSVAQNISTVNVLIKTTLSRVALNKLGVSVHAQIGDIVSAAVPIDQIPNLAAHPEIFYIQGPRVVSIQNDVSVAEIGAKQAAQQYNLTGKGIIVGIVDTGIDWRHPDFRNANGTTRIKALLDLTEPGPDRWGSTLHTEQEINNALNGIGTVSEKDYVGHGTHVAGSAAGNGRATGNSIPANTYVGVAPEADLIIVKATTDKQSINFETNAYINAISFIDSLANLWKKPYVINLSLGGSLGPHDGKDLSEQAIDNLLKESGGKGRSIVVSAGNDGDDDIHASGTFGAGVTSIETQFTVPSYTPNSDNSNDYIIFEGWYDGIYNYSVKVTSPSGTATSTVSSGQDKGVELNDGAVYISNAKGGASALNGDKQIAIQVYDFTVSKPPKQGTWKISIYGSTGRFDLWLSGSSMNAAISSNLDRKLIVGTPGTAFKAITVGSYITKKSWTDLDGNRLQYSNLMVGNASDFSSPGPTRDNRVKPEIAAPGELITASYSADAPPSSQYSIFKSDNSQYPNAYIVRDGKHGITQGTSFAAPHVAGAIALMLQQHPTKTVDEIRQSIILTARKDNFTGAVPNNKWGYGKLDVLAAVKLLSVKDPDSGTPVPTSVELYQNYPNPFNPTTVIPYSITTTTDVQVAIFNLLGQKIRTLLNNRQVPGNYRITWDGKDDWGKAVSSGVYFYRLDGGNFSQTRKMILLP